MDFYHTRTPLIATIGVLIGLLGLNGCSQPLTATLPPPPQTITIALPLALSPLQPALQACANAQPDLLINLRELPNRPPEPETADMSLWFGEPPDGFEFAVQLAEETLAILVNPSNPVTELNNEQLRGIFSGELHDWSSLDGETGQIQVWVYPEGNQVRKVFDQAILPDESSTSLAKLAPTAEAMLAGIAEDSAAIGYAPMARVDATVKSLVVGDTTQAALRLPVLGLTPAKPRGAVRDFLVCLQSGEGRASIAKFYALGDRE